LASLDEREHLLGVTQIVPLRASDLMWDELDKVAQAIHRARAAGSSILLLIGAHVIRSGVQRFIIDLMERGCISCIAMNGACVIHDFEFALIGATTERVEKYIGTGRFGLWRETGRLNDIARTAAGDGEGLGRATGRFIEEEGLPHRDISLLAAAYRLGVLATVHVSIGCDILHEHPNFDGAAYGEASYRDFLRFVSAVEGLGRDGVVMNVGSAVMGPEVFLKALAMARNAAPDQGERISGFTTLVCDLLELPSDYRTEPPTGIASYYFRPWKTLLVRTPGRKGESYYVRGDHREVVPALWTAVTR